MLVVGVSVYLTRPMGTRTASFLRKVCYEIGTKVHTARGTVRRKEKFYKFPSFPARPFSSDSLVHLGPRQGLTL